MALVVEPKELLFRGTFTKPVNTTLTLFNTSNRYVAFKLLTTSQNHFKVSTIRDIMAPGQVQVIEVQLQAVGDAKVIAEQGPFNLLKKQRFMVKSTFVDDDKQDVNEIITNTQKEKLVETKIKCEFEQTATDDNDTVQVGAFPKLSSQSPSLGTPAHISSSDVSASQKSPTSYVETISKPLSPSSGGSLKTSIVSDDSKVSAKMANQPESSKPRGSFDESRSFSDGSNAHKSEVSGTKSDQVKDQGHSLHSQVAGPKLAREYKSDQAASTKLVSWQKHQRENKTEPPRPNSKRSTGFTPFSSESDDSHLQVALKRPGKISAAEELDELVANPLMMITISAIVLALIILNIILW